MSRNGRAYKPTKSETASCRPATLGLMSLLGTTGAEIETPETMAEAFLGRMMRVNDGEAWALLAEPYCRGTQGYDVMGRNIKNMYKRYVSKVGWSEEQFFRILAWILETKRNIDSFEFDKVYRMYEAGRLGLGVLTNLSVDTYEKITNSTVGA